MSNKGHRRRGGVGRNNRQQQQGFPDIPSAGPSVPPPFPFYDRYVPDAPLLPAPGFHEGFPNEFGPPAPNFWGPDRDFFQAPQTPDRFRPSQPEGPWTRPPPWNDLEPPVWQERPETPRETYAPMWNRTSAPPPSRMFEPSDNWKQTHAERPRGREHYSPSQPVAESQRYRPYSPVRNRLPPLNPRSDSYRPSYNDDWVPDDSDPYDSSSRDYRTMPYYDRSVTPDRSDGRYRGRDSDERSVSPASPHSQRSSSPYGPPPPPPAIPKRESPEPQLPHLETFSGNSGDSSQGIPIPTDLITTELDASSLPPSRSSSDSSSNSGILPHQQLHAHLTALILRPPLPIKPTTSAPTNTSLAAIPAGLEHPVPPKPVAIVQPKKGQGRHTLGRRSYFHNAPAFVPSTLAIDAPLMFPASGPTSESATVASVLPPTLFQASVLPPMLSRDDVPDSSVAKITSDVSIPKSAPPKAPSIFRSNMETDSTRTLHPSLPSKPVAHVPGVAASDGDAADASDMDMSPPGTPVLTSASLPPPPKEAPPAIPTEIPGPSRPSLAIDTSLPLQLLPHEVLKQSSSISPASGQDADETGGDASDMDMSSPASEAPPSPLPEPPKLLEPAPSSLNALSSESTPPGLMFAGQNAALRVQLTPTPASAPASTSGSTPTVSSLPFDHAKEAPTALPPRQITPASSAREVSVQVSPRLATVTAPLEHLHAESGELSPPASEETLREESECVGRDAGNKQVGNDVVRALPKDVPMVIDEPSSDKVITEIPLSEALRMVARLRYRHDAYTQDARIEPILISNRQLVSPEQSPPPTESNIVATIAEKEQQQALEGAFDGTKHSLRKRFAQRQAALAEKVARLRKEYLALHEKWLVHCAKLDEEARSNALEEAAASACRTTRRTAAMGDAVRTDLEMEQILASLGNEELTDANHLSAKNAAVIPDMVSVTKGSVDYIYDDTNNLVEDPHEFYKLETGIDDWTQDEKDTMVQQYAKFPKQFGFIADALPNKTPAQCVSFYYLHKNTTIDFRKAVAKFNTVGKRRRSGRKQKGNALIADILKHDDEVSQSTAPNSSGRRKRGGPSTPVPPSASVESIENGKKTTASTSRRGTAQNTPAATPTPDPEPAPKRPRRRVNPTARAVAAMEQDTGVDGDEDTRPAKRTRKGRKSKADADVVESMLAVEEASPTPAESKSIEGITESSDVAARKKAPGNASSWTVEDKDLFLKLLAQHGDDFKRIASAMPNKTTVQVSSFYRSNLTEMRLAKVAALAPKRSPTPLQNASGSGKQGVTSTGTVVWAAVAADLAGGGGQAAAAALGAESRAEPGAAARSRSSGRMSPPPPPNASQPTQPQQRLTSVATTVVPREHVSPYYGGLRSVFAGGAHGTASLLPSGVAAGMPTGVGLGAMGIRAPPPPTFGMPFPAAMAYSGLAPSSFVSGTHVGVPVNPSGFAPPTWQVPMSPGVPIATPVGAAGTGPGAGDGPPPALGTMDDLVQYLEHRTRVTTVQNDSSFM